MSSKKDFKNILIVGLGLIGGSIAKKLKDISYPAKIFGLEKDSEIIEKANEESLISNDSNIDLSALDDLLIIFSTPVLSFKDALESVILMKPTEKAIYTDTLSTKSHVLQTLKDFSSVKNKFVLSHPIAGSEKSGLESSKRELFDNRVSVISPHETNMSEDIDKVINFWNKLGSKTKILSAKEHDTIFAKTSHLPHVISYALTESLFNKLNEKTFEFSGGSLEDYTRIASSDPIMWKDILISNHNNLLDSIKDFEKSLKKLKGLIESKDEEGLIEFLSKIKSLRDSSIGGN